MSRYNKIIFSAALLTLLVSAGAFAGLKPGDNLPDLKSFKLEGTLPEPLKGKVILLDFWASWCAPCKVSFPAMEKLRQQFADAGLTIIAISVDEDRENMQQFLKSEKVSFAILRDVEQQLVAKADVQTMPTSFLIDRTGKIRFLHDGFHGDETVKQYNDEIKQLLKEPQP